MSQITCPNTPSCPSTPTCCSTPSCPSTPTRPSKSVCPGCHPVYQPNQLAHMDEGGCLYLDFSDEDFSNDEDDDNEDDEASMFPLTDLPQQNLCESFELETQESITDSSMDDLGFSEPKNGSVKSSISSVSSPFSEKTGSSSTHFPKRSEGVFKVINSDNVEETVECCICYDPISTEKNNCVTECGHQFCFKCLATSMMTNGCKCPCCRSPLVEISSDEEEEEDDDEETELDNDSIVSLEEDEIECDIVELTRRLKSKGFKMQDVLSMLLGRYIKDATDLTIFDLNQTFDTIVDEADNEAIENEAMGLEDNRKIVG